MEWKVEEQVAMLTDNGILLEGCEPWGHYLQDDIARGLRASLVEVLAAALADNETGPDFFKGVFSLARSQAGLYGISWCDLIQSLCDTPELCRLVSLLQEGAQK